MKYKEFLSAANKHHISCLAIKDSLELLDESDSGNLSKVRSLTLNLYYIAGYVIECSVKYGIYVYAQYGEDDCVKKLDTPEVQYSKHIKHHRFDRYSDILASKNGEIPLIANSPQISKEVKILFNSWDADIRYVFDELPAHNINCATKLHVLNFFDYATLIFKSIQSKLR